MKYLLHSYNLELLFGSRKSLERCVFDKLPSFFSLPLPFFSVSLLPSVEFVSSANECVSPTAYYIIVSIFSRPHRDALAVIQCSPSNTSCGHTSVSDSSFIIEESYVASVATMQPQLHHN